PLELVGQCGDQRPALVVDRAATAEQRVVLTDLGQPLVRDAPPPGHIAEERHHVLGGLRSAERHQHHGVVRAKIGCCGCSSHPRIFANQVRPRARGGETVTTSTVRRGIGGYLTLLSDRTALAFTLAGFIARLPVSMSGLGIVLLISLPTGSYGSAGLVTACATLTGAVASPWWGRRIDRIGQARSLVVAALICNLSLVLLIVTVQLRLPLPVTCLAAVGVGLGTPSAGSAVRARW